MAKTHEKWHRSTQICNYYRKMNKLNPWPPKPLNIDIGQSFTTSGSIESFKKIVPQQHYFCQFSRRTKVNKEAQYGHVIQPPTYKARRLFSNQQRFPRKSDIGDIFAHHLIYHLIILSDFEGSPILGVFLSGFLDQHWFRCLTSK